MRQSAWERKVSKEQLCKYTKTFVWKSSATIDIRFDHIKHFESTDDLDSWCKENFSGRYRLKDREVLPTEVFDNIPTIVTLKNRQHKSIKTFKNIAYGPMGNASFSSPRVSFAHKLWLLATLPLIECEYEDDAVLFNLIFSGDS